MDKKKFTHADVIVTKKNLLLRNKRLVRIFVPIEVYNCSELWDHPSSTLTGIYGISVVPTYGCGEIKVVYECMEVG